MNRITNAMLMIPLLAAGVGLAPVTAESVDVYTDRGDWMATVTTVRLGENFQSETPGTYGTPYQTVGGINVERLGIMFIDLVVRDNGAVDNSRELLIRDYGERASFTFPSNRRQLAFGFDWATGGEAWTLKFLGQEYTLLANSSGFMGLVDSDGQSFGFELTSPTATQDGLAIDNLAFSPALFVYTSRIAWEAALGMSPQQEAFENDTPGAYQTPFTTGGGCDLHSLGAAIDLNVIDGGLIDGSRELHLRDYGEQLSLGFPGAKTQAGFGFDWKTTQEAWNLIVREEHVSLSGTGEGFVGIVDQTKETLTFILSSSIVVQEGVHIDNLSYSEGTIPVAPATWGLIKTMFSRN